MEPRLHLTEAPIKIDLTQLDKDWMKRMKMTKLQVQRENRSREKLFIVYEEILRLEEKMGHYVILGALEESIAIRNKNKKNKLKITNRELKKIIEDLMVIGVVFIPRGGFVQRTYTFNWKDVKNNVKMHNLEVGGKLK